MSKGRLRHGFTTGSAAAAGAKAGILFLAGYNSLEEIEIPLPGGGRLTIPIADAEPVEGGCSVTIIKDGGDDPDITHKARIRSIVRLLPEGEHGYVSIKGGKGVGMVTRPGLPVPVGEPAINPVPRQQIREAVLEGLDRACLKGSVSVTIEVVNGEKIAKKTLNPRLGIVGGISILGSRGTVRPFSNKAYMDTIAISMDVVKAGGLRRIALSTGGTSEMFLKRLLPGLPEVCFIQAGDFFSFSLNEAVKRDFQDIHYACFFGKLIKMAQGHPYTHARKCRIDFGLLASWCLSLGMGEEKALRVAKANTGREALGVIIEDTFGKEILYYTMKKVINSARRFSGFYPDLTFYLFDFDGELLATHRDPGKSEE
nr:cobalt-precorrin-5B (C(1))-methyltransferase [Desulfobacterales bacterium]